MGSLTLLSPSGLALLALLAPLVVFYVLKIRRKRMRVPSTWLWASAKRDLMARSPFQKLVAQVPLFLEALALIALAFAFARPVSRSDAASGEHLAIVVDVSASMSATVGSSSRLDAAKKLARDTIASLPPGTEVMLIAAGRDAHIASALDRDAARSKAAIDALAVEDVEGDLGPALGLASDRLARLSRGRIVVITDGALAHPDALDGVAVPIEVSLVGEPQDNLAIVRVDVRGGTDPATKREEVRAFLVLASSAKGPRDVYVTMREENASDILASRRVLVKPGEKLPVVMSFEPTPGDRGKGLVFDVSPHDAMPIDDVAFGRVPSADKLPVVLVSAADSGPIWLKRALSSDPSVELSKGKPADVADGAALDPGTLVVVDGACPDDPGGGDLFIVHPPEGRCQGVEIGKPIERPSITSWSPTDPRLRFVSLDGVGIARANALTIADPKRALVTGRDGPLVVDASRPGRAVTIVGFDPGDSDWPLKASFVLFVRDILEEARQHRASGVAAGTRTGAPLLVDVPSTTAMAELTRPLSRAEPIVARGGLVVVPDVTRAGLYRVAYDKPVRRTIVVPVNLASEAESDLRRTLAPRSQGPVTVHEAADRPKAYADHAWLLALLALALFIADIVWLTRRPAKREAARKSATQGAP